MKKKVLLSMMTLAAVTVGAFTGYKTLEKKASTSDLLLTENIEALSSEENGSKTYVCYNSITSKDGNMVRYCPTCTYVPGTDTWYAPEHTCTKK
ncbi:MAG TPA: hypothetical protein DIS88_09585 [Prevotella sp.]|nr:hypothetical protein [Prevotella sp.]